MGHLSMAGKEKEMLESEGDVRECRQREGMEGKRRVPKWDGRLAVFLFNFLFWGGASMVCRKGEHPFWVRPCSV